MKKVLLFLLLGQAFFSSAYAEVEPDQADAASAETMPAAQSDDKWYAGGGFRPQPLKRLESERDGRVLSGSRLFKIHRASLALV